MAEFEISWKKSASSIVPTWWEECAHARAVGIHERSEGTGTGTRKVKVEFVLLLALDENAWTIFFGEESVKVNFGSGA